MITVFYDGGCGLCGKEIRHYQRIAPVGVFDWQDISRNAQVLPSSLSYSDAMKNLHVMDGQNRLHIGVNAFCLIWQHLPRWRWLAWLVKKPLIRPFAAWLYHQFSQWRFQRLTACDVIMTTDQSRQIQEQADDVEQKKGHSHVNHNPSGSSSGRHHHPFNHQ